MSRIAHTFQQPARRGRKALIPTSPQAIPFADATAELMHGLVDAGADVIELGVPFSDPMADGPVIQKAAERALARGIGLPQVLDFVRGFRRSEHRHAGGADGLCQPDRALRPAPGPARSSRAAERPASTACWWSTTRRRSARRSRPSLKQARPRPDLPARADSTDARIAQVARIASGYVYYVSLRGRDRRRPSRHGSGGGSDAAHPRAM